MPTKLPNPSVEMSLVSLRPKPLPPINKQRVLRPWLLLSGCLGGTLLSLMLPLDGAALTRLNAVPETTGHSENYSPQLVAQQVIDGLPPPPPIPDLQAPNDAALPQGSGPQGASQEDTGEIYMVYVNGDSPLLLEQVRQVEPTARVQSLEGQQVILAGLFDRSSTANEQIEKLDQRGIDANVVSVSSVVLSPNAPSTNVSAPSTVRGTTSGDRSQSSQANFDELPPADPVVAQVNRQPRPSVSVAPPSITSPSITSPPATSSGSSATVTNAPRRDNAYYVVIPGNEDELGAMREQVLLLGAAPNAVEQRDRPLGPHLLIGPFVSQSAATRWNRFFQDFGMDARVYYKR